MPAITAKYPTPASTISVKIMPPRKIKIDFIALVSSDEIAAVNRQDGASDEGGGLRMRITNCHDPLFETHRRNSRLGLFYFFGFAACFAAAIARPFCLVAAAFACFCAACFCVAFGDLSPISLSYHPWFQELKNSRSLAAKK
jgi:hypothetical protein